MVKQKDFDEFAKEVREFIDQYNLDMRGDMNVDEDGRLGLIANVREMKRIQQKYPSITWLFAHKPIPTIAITIGVFLVLYGTLYAGVLQMIASMVGVDTSGIHVP